MSAPGTISNYGVMWRDMHPMRLVKQFYSCHIATVVIIISGCGLGIGMRLRH